MFRQNGLDDLSESLLHLSGKYIFGPRDEEIDICGQLRPRSAYTFAQSDQDLCCSLEDILVTVECNDIL